MLLGLLWLVAGGPSLAQEPSAPTLLVSGTAELRVEPDRAQVRLGVSTESSDAGTAQAEINRTASAIAAAVEQLGVEPSAIQTARISLYPVYDRRRPGADGQAPPIVGYRGSNVITVTLDELTLIGKVVDAAISAGANQVEGVAFTLRDDRPVQARALAAAIADARAKAEAMAAALGQPLGEVVEVQESGAAVAQPPRIAAYARMQLEAAAPATPVAPGLVTVAASVSVRFALAEPGS